MTELRDLLLPTDYVTLRMALVDEVGFDAAVLLERVRWRCEIRDDGWVATYEDLMAETRLSRRRVAGAVATLRERGWLTSENAGQGSRTLCWQVILDPKVQNGTMGGIVPERADLRPETGLCTSYRELREHTPDESGESLFDTPPAPSQRLVEPPAEWDIFWSLYPRKVGKLAATKAFTRATAGGKNGTSPGVIVAGLKRQLPEMKARDPKYIPHPTTWLNEGRWADETVVQIQGLPPVPKMDMYG